MPNEHKGISQREQEYRALSYHYLAGNSVLPSLSCECLRAACIVGDGSFWWPRCKAIFRAWNVLGDYRNGCVACCRGGACFLSTAYQTTTKNRFIRKRFTPVFLVVALLFRTRFYLEISVLGNEIYSPFPASPGLGTPSPGNGGRGNKSLARLLQTS